MKKYRIIEEKDNAPSGNTWYFIQKHKNYIFWKKWRKCYLNMFIYNYKYQTLNEAKIMLSILNKETPEKTITVIS